MKKKLPADIRYQKRILERLGFWRDGYTIDRNKITLYQEFPMSIESMFPDSKTSELKFCFEFLGFELVKKFDCSNRKADKFDVMIYTYEKQFA